MRRALALEAVVVAEFFSFGEGASIGGRGGYMERRILISDTKRCMLEMWIYSVLHSVAQSNKRMTRFDD